MPSLRQLIIISSIVIACILIGMLAMGLNLMGRSLDAQLQTDGENAVATLALLVSEHPDGASAAPLLDVVFQQGRYQSLVLRTADGRMIFEAHRALLDTGGAPAWFGALVPVNARAAQRVVPGTGVLQLLMDARPAREALWNHAVQWGLMAIGIALFWALFVAALMARMRHEWDHVGGADDGPGIQIKDSVRVESAELLDTLHERVPPSVDEQMARIDRLELELNRDPATGMANRAYFLNELKRLLRDDAGMGAVGGYVLLMRQRDMAEMLDQSSRHEIEDWFRLLGRRVTTALADFPAVNPLAARLNGSDCVVLFPGGGGPEITRPVQSLRHLLDTLRVPLDSRRKSRWALAMTDYAAGCTVKDVLTRLDTALMSAESAGGAEVEFLSHIRQGASGPQVGEAAWRALLNQALRDELFALNVQPALYEGDDVDPRSEGELVLHETASDQAPLSGFLFMPAATRLGLSTVCDARAITLGLAWLAENPGMLVLRVSLSSLLDDHFTQDVVTICRRIDPETLSRLTLELDAYGLSAFGDTLRTFTRRMTDLGVHVGLRRLDAQTDALQHIHEADFSYVKLGGNFMRGMLLRPGGIQIMVAVTETAIGLGMKVYVDDVADEGTRQLVQEYGAMPRLQ
ncbi:MAG: EAL domain-containing protein [Alcaligenaceae bacterium]|nr:EAL domain-containing protein [Alcaligenaceae bacterium]